jgi:hypothetical protein
MPRPANGDPPKKLTVNLPLSLVTQLEFHLFDPMTRKREYGALSTLIEALLRQWLAFKLKETVHD